MLLSRDALTINYLLLYTVKVQCAALHYMIHHLDDAFIQMNLQ